MTARFRIVVALLSCMFAFSVAYAEPPAVSSAAPKNNESLEAPPAAETYTVGTLRVQRYGDHGRPLILIPGLEGGSWVWRSTIAHFRGDHVIYAVTLAGFDGLLMPKDHSDLLGQADASLLELIESRHLDKPVLIGHSLGGTLSIRFAEEHSNLIGGVIAVDGLPILPGFDRVTPAQRKAFTDRMVSATTNATPQQYQAQVLGFMQHVGTIDPAKAKLYAPFNARSDQKAVAEYLKEDAESDYRSGLKNIHVPLLEISPYYKPDFSSPPVASGNKQSGEAKYHSFTATRKADYYKILLAGDPTAEVLTIEPSRHFVMLDQPAKLNQAIVDFLKQL